jgi:hypothetical protein
MKNGSDQVLLISCKAIALAVLSGIERRGFAVGASPSGKAPDFDSGIRRFDPSRPSQPTFIVYCA